MKFSLISFYVGCGALGHEDKVAQGSSLADLIPCTDACIRACITVYSTNACFTAACTNCNFLCLQALRAILEDEEVRDEQSISVGRMPVGTASEDGELGEKSGRAENSEDGPNKNAVSSSQLINSDMYWLQALPCCDHALGASSAMA